MDHLPEPAIELWHKVLPLGLIFFCASFNLTILQVSDRWPGSSTAAQHQHRPRSGSGKAYLAPEQLYSAAQS